MGWVGGGGAEGPVTSFSLCVTTAAQLKYPQHLHLSVQMLEVETLHKYRVEL